MSPNLASNHSLEVLYNRVLSINDRLRDAKPDISKKARWFAHLISLFWVYFSIGHWYGSRFIALESRPDITFLFGAVFIVWFAAFFAYIGGYMLFRSKV